MLDVNVVGVFLGMKHVLPVMLKQDKGSIINTASIAGLMGSPRIAVYSASKHAVIGLTKTAAWECTGTGVRVNCVCPGMIDSRMLSTILQGRTEAIRRLPTTRSSTGFRRGGSDRPRRSPPSSPSWPPTRGATSRDRPTPSMAAEPPHDRHSGARVGANPENAEIFRVRCWRIDRNDSSKKGPTMPVILDPDAAAVFKAFQEAGRPPSRPLGISRPAGSISPAASSPTRNRRSLHRTKPLSIPVPARNDPRAHLHAEKSEAERRSGASAGVLSRRRLGDRRSRFP